MIEQRTPRDRTLRRHLRDQATIDHLVREVYDGRRFDPGIVHEATTGTGLPVEEQVRKQWGPHMGGLPVF